MRQVNNCMELEDKQFKYIEVIKDEIYRVPFRSNEMSNKRLVKFEFQSYICVYEFQSYICVYELQFIKLFNIHKSKIP